VPAIKTSSSAEAVRNDPSVSLLNTALVHRATFTQLFLHTRRQVLVQLSLAATKDTLSLDLEVLWTFMICEFHDQAELLSHRIGAGADLKSKHPHLE
jgi:hypothetical protein